MYNKYIKDDGGASSTPLGSTREEYNSWTSTQPASHAVLLPSGWSKNNTHTFAQVSRKFGPPRRFQSGNPLF